MTTYNSDNTPNAAKLMESLRHSGYDNNIAISDLIDNSIDAAASVIEVRTSEKLKADSAEIAIIDNGTGMDEKTLSQALRLGSISEREEKYTLGRFGLGMVTASISIARRITVYTRVKGGPLYVACLDLDEMKRTNKFHIYLGEADDNEAADSYGLGEHGTVVVLGKCDKIGVTDVTEFEKKLAMHLGEVYRHLLRNGKRMSVNGKAVDVVDPMWSDGYFVDKYGLKSELHSEREITLKTDSGSHNFKARIYVLPGSMSKEMKKETEFAVTGQGFYVLRNYRQIARGDKFGGLWNPHNSLNRVRVELFVTGALDEAMGINYTKHSIKPSRAMMNKVEEDIMKEVESLKKKYPRGKKAKGVPADIDYAEAEAEIKEKQSLLEWAVPAPTIKKTGPSRPRVGEPRVVSVAAHSRTLPGGMAAVFETSCLGAAGPVLTASKRDGITVVSWNEDHPFFENFVLKYADEEGFGKSVLLLGFSIAEAKLAHSHNDSEKLDAFMESMSKNLGTLLG